jgi:hypothetical protein
MAVKRAVNFLTACKSLVIFLSSRRPSGVECARIYFEGREIIEVQRLFTEETILILTVALVVSKSRTMIVDLDLTGYYPVVTSLEEPA